MVLEVDVSKSRVEQKFNLFEFLKMTSEEMAEHRRQDKTETGIGTSQL